LKRVVLHAAHRGALDVQLERPARHALVEDYKFRHVSLQELWARRGSSQTQIQKNKPPRRPKPSCQFAGADMKID
jgi:hypothetical protein